MGHEGAWKGAWKRAAHRGRSAVSVREDGGETVPTGEGAPEPFDDRFACGGGTK